MNPQKRESLLNKSVGITSHAGAVRCAIILSGVLLLAAQASAAPFPFKGKIDGTFVTRPTTNSTTLLAQAHATGSATQVGEFTKVTSDVVDLTTLAIKGSFKMTTAKGDHVTGEYGGPLTPGAAPGTFSWVLNATITGGDGRFSRASGAFVFKAEGHLTGTNGVFQGSYTETFDGTINY